jgi:Cft2 family RNA processing exonuclease
MFDYWRVVFFNHGYTDKMVSCHHIGLQGECVLWEKGEES